MSVEWLIPAMLTIVTAATPLVFAAVGETVVEKAGVLNLGVEGMMIIGAIAAFAMAVTTGNTYVLKPSEKVPLTAMRHSGVA